MTPMPLTIGECTAEPARAISQMTDGRLEFFRAGSTRCHPAPDHPAGPLC
jgi:hypothetical protein